MIPGVMTDFLARASVAIAGTRDAALTPAVHPLTGWLVEADGGSVGCLVSAEFAPRLIADAEDNGHVTLVAEVIGPHECYQFKGRYTGSRDLTAADRRTHEACRRRFVDAVRRHTGDRYTEPTLARWYREPAVAFSFAVDEIFVQTPGPGAGGRLYPPAED